MDNILKRLAALSPSKLTLLRERVNAEGFDLDELKALSLDLIVKASVDNTLSPLSIQPTEAKEYYPLSSVQRRLFLLSRFDGAGVVYNVFSTRLARGYLDNKKLEETFNALVKRHEAFRTSFRYVHGEPVQRVYKPEDTALEIEYHDAQETTVHGIIKNFIRPFDLSKAPLLRIGIVKLSETEHVLMYDAHHIVVDGTSRGIIAKEFVALYNNRDLPSLDIQYKDFAVWLNTPHVQVTLKKQEKYWVSEFSSEIPVLKLPIDFQRPPEKNFDGDSILFTIKEKDVKALKKLCSRKNTTLFTVFLASYNVFLSKITGQKDIITGIPINGRRHAGLENVIGMFVNTLVLRNYPEDERTFEEFLDQVKLRTLDAFENQDYQFEDLVNIVVKQRDPGRNPIFDAFFSFTYPGVTADLEEEWDHEGIAGLKLEGYGENPFLSMFDLYFFGKEEKNETDSLMLGFTYAAALFKKDTIERFTGYFKEIISAAADNPGMKLKDINISHQLGIARTTLFEDEGESDFDF
jgi:hypothetical protein